MKIFMTILSVVLISYTLSAEVFTGAVGYCARSTSAEIRTELIKLSTEKAVAACVASNFSARDCLSAVPVSTESYDDISTGGSMCRGPVVTTLIQVGKPACK